MILCDAFSDRVHLASNLVAGVYDEGCDGSVVLCDVGFNLDTEEGREFKHMHVFDRKGLVGIVS